MPVSLADLDTMRRMAERVDPNPVSLGVRLLGLSASEQRAGVPGWGYVALGVGAGFLLGIVAMRTEFLRSALGSE
jgi:hypothetical protein